LNFGLTFQFTTPRKHKIKPEITAKIGSFGFSLSVRSILSSVIVLKIKKYIFGFLIGLVNALFGAGGGMIAVPFLKTLGLSQKQAQATAICIILPLTLVSIVIYLKRDYFSVSDAAPFLLFGFPGALLGTLLLSKLNNSFLQGLFSVFMLWAGFRMVVG